MDAADPRHSSPSRREQAEATYERLFGARDRTAHEDDPELMEILRGFIFGDVFGTGVLDDRTRELITVTVLACLQTLPQLSAHTTAALRVGVPPVQIREAVYQLAPVIGFPRALNALAAINAVFRDRGIPLPLPGEGADDDAGRSRAPTGTSGAWRSRSRSTVRKSGMTWPICRHRSTKPCPGSSPSSTSVTSIPAAPLLRHCGNCWLFAPLPPSATLPPSWVRTGAPACRWAIRKPRSSPPWCTASRTWDSPAWWLPSAR